MRRMKVQINEMRLRVPGLARTEGLRLGELVAKHLSEFSVGVHQSQNIPRVSIRLQLQEDYSPEHVARAIAAKIRSRIGSR